MRRRLSTLVVVGMAALAFAACSSSKSSSSSTTTGGSSGYGKAGDPAKADRTVAVAITSANKYDPASITVKPGETVTFNVTNQGTTIHEFVLGDQKVQDDYQKTMSDMGNSPMSMADKPNLRNINPGQTESLTWTFPSSGTVIYASHEPGDPAAGLTGLITVTP